MRRAHRRGRLDRERDPGLPLAVGALGAVRPARLRLDRGVPRRSRAGLALLRAALRDADGGRAERRAPRARGARAARPARRRRDAEHRPPARRGPGAATWSRCTARSARRRCPRCRRVVPARRGAAADRGRRRRAALPGVRRGAQAGRRLLRRAAAGGGDRPRVRARAERARCCSSSARRSRCIPSPGSRSRRCARAAGSRS